MYSAGKRILQVFQNANRLHAPQVWGTYTPASLGFPYPRHKGEQKPVQFPGPVLFYKVFSFPFASKNFPISF